MLSKVRFNFIGIVFSSVFLFCACEKNLSSDPPPSPKEEKTPSFFKARKEKHPEKRQAVLKVSQKLYSKERSCSSDSSCIAICHRLFSLEWDRQDCVQLPAPQIYKFEKLYDHVLEKDLDSLQKINAFDLKVFLSLSPEPLFKFFKTLGPFSTKIFLHWIANNWQIAKIFSEEDWDFLFLDIFLNEIHVSPINSLREVVAKDRIFIELAWLEQNDHVFFWIDDYFTKVQCLNFKGEEMKNCVLAQYCQLSGSLPDETLQEIMDFKNLKENSNQEQSLPQTDFKDFCPDFCSSEQNQKYCR